MASLGADYDLGFERHRAGLVCDTPLPPMILCALQTRLRRVHQYPWTRQHSWKLTQVDFPESFRGPKSEGLGVWCTTMATAETMW